MVVAGGCCGLVVKDTSHPVALKTVDYSVQIKSFAYQVEILQSFKNDEQTDLECVYAFPINDSVAITGLTIKIDDRVIEGQFKKKDHAFQEYNEALERGDGAYLLDQSDESDDTYVLSVGRLPPGKECTVALTYVGTLESVNDTTLRLVIPTALSPRYTPASQVQTGSMEAVKNAPFEAKVPYSCTLRADVTAMGAIKAIVSSSHQIISHPDGEKRASVTFADNAQEMNRDFVLDIALHNNQEHFIEVESYAPGKFAALYSFVPSQLPESGGLKSELIFLVDCSGSMEGDRIRSAVSAMQLFLRSIPEGCFFNFYRFGSSFEALFEESQSYGESTFKKAQQYASETRANMGGTEILSALEKIYSVERKAGYTRQLFILTDGEVSNTKEVIALVGRNADNTRVFTFGVGDSPSRSLVNGVALAGNGTAEFVKSADEVPEQVLRQLGRALRPAITDISVYWNGLKNVQQAPTVLPPAFSGERQLAFALFDGLGADTTASVDAQVASQRYHLPLDIPSTPTANPFIQKLAARALIKELQTRKVVEGDLAERITDLSVQFSILSEYVSLVAVERRENGSGGPMELRYIPIQQNKPDPPKRRLPVMGYRSCGPKRTARKCALRIGSARKAAGLSDEENSDTTEENESVEDVSGSEMDIRKKQLKDLLLKQIWNGSWGQADSLGKLLPNIVQIVESLAAKHRRLAESVLTTLTVRFFVGERFADLEALWKPVMAKAVAYLRKELTEEQEMELRKDIKSIFVTLPAETI